MDRIQVLERAFLILEVIASSPNDPHKISDLARKTKLTVPTVSRIVRTMSELGYLEFIGRKRGYVLGKRIPNLSRYYRDQNPLRHAAQPFLRNFKELYGEYICVSCLLSLKRHIICSEPSTHLVQVPSSLFPEVEIPYRSVSGRVLLAGLERSEQERCFEFNGAPGDLWKEVRTKKELFFETERIARLEYLLETESEMVMIAYPIRQERQIIAAIGVYMPEYRFQGERRAGILEFMKKTALGIAKSALL